MPYIEDNKLAGLSQKVSPNFQGFNSCPTCISRNRNCGKGRMTNRLQISITQRGIRFKFQSIKSVAAMDLSGRQHVYCLQFLDRDADLQYAEGDSHPFDSLGDSLDFRTHVGTSRSSALPWMSLLDMSIYYRKNLWFHRIFFLWKKNLRTGVFFPWKKFSEPRTRGFSMEKFSEHRTRGFSIEKMFWSSGQEVFL